MKVLLATFLLFVTWAQNTQTADERAVQAADTAWAEAAKSKDVDRMLSFYDQDATFISPTGAVIRGKDELRKLWNRFFQSSGYALTWRATKVEVSKAGDLAYSFGAWEQTEMRDGQEKKTKGTYVAVWKKQADGNWKVLVDKP